MKINIVEVRFSSSNGGQLYYVTRPSGEPIDWHERIIATFEAEDARKTVTRYARPESAEYSPSSTRAIFYIPSFVPIEKIKCSYEIEE
jgi:hypothetical protein